MQRMATATDVKRWLADAANVTFLTGAGISTDSGIPDYRGPQGVWTKDPEAEKMATLSHYLHDPEVRKRSWRTRSSSPVWLAKPNAAHVALAQVDRAVIVTQNVDGLHQIGGSDPEQVIEIHGSMRSTTCWVCGDRRPMDEALDRVAAGEEDPPCLACGGILKSSTISFGQQLDPVVLGRAQVAADSADVFIALGTSLTVQPAASLAPRARRKGALLVIANAEETPYDGIAAAVLRQPLGELVPSLVGPA
ncbi:MAG: NAD-dependent protein deacetylase [Acidimicrobiales bacterium]